jgi:hypothetical protein
VAQTQKFLVALDLRGNEIRNFVLGTNAGTAAGAIWFDTTTNLITFVGENGAVQTVAPKSFVEAQVADLQASITTNVAQLSADIAAEASARSAAVSAVEASLASEVTRATAAEALLDAAVTAEASRATAAEAALAQDITDEATSRTAADASLQSQIDDVVADLNALDTTYASDAELAAEATARAAADSALDTRVTATESKNTAQDTAITGLTADLATESSARSAADSALDSRVTTVEGVLNNLDASFATEAELSAAVAAEAARAQSAEAGLASDVAANASSIAGVASDLATETTRATAAEAAITANLDQAVANLNYGITEVADFLDVVNGNMQAADAALDTRVTGLENFSATVVTGVQLTAAMETEVARADAYADAAALAAENNAKAYADLRAQGLNVKESVRAVVMQGPGLSQPLSGTYTAFSTVGYNPTTNVFAYEAEDFGVALAVGDHVLVTDYEGSTPAGIYTVQSGAWTLRADWDNDTTKVGSFVYVAEGWFAGTAWAAVEVPHPDGHYFNFTQMTGVANVFSSDETVSLSGPSYNDLSINVAKLVELHAVARKAVATIGDGSATSFTVAHTLGQDVTVSVRDTATGELVMAGVSCGVSSVTIDFASAPSADAYRVVIIG